MVVYIKRYIKIMKRKWNWYYENEYSWYIDYILIMHRCHCVLWTSETSFHPTSRCLHKLRCISAFGQSTEWCWKMETAERQEPIHSTHHSHGATVENTCLPPGWTTLSLIGRSHRLRAIQSQCVCVCVCVCVCFINIC